MSDVTHSHESFQHSEPRRVVPAGAEGCDPNPTQLPGITCWYCPDRPQNPQIPKCCTGSQGHNATLQQDPLAQHTRTLSLAMQSCQHWAALFGPDPHLQPCHTAWVAHWDQSSPCTGQQQLQIPPGTQATDSNARRAQAHLPLDQPLSTSVTIKMKTMPNSHENHLKTLCESLTPVHSDRWGGHPQDKQQSHTQSLLAPSAASARGRLVASGGPVGKQLLSPRLSLPRKCVPSSGCASQQHFAGLLHHGTSLPADPQHGVGRKDLAQQPNPLRAHIHLFASTERPRSRP